MLHKYTNIFIIGIKGVAMANLARILHQMGKQVSGSDTAEEFITDKVLTESKIQLITSFEAKDLPQKTDLVVYSAAHGGINNPQVQEALKRCITAVHQVALLGEILKNYQTSIAVCGCHGKTTTSAMLSYALKNLQAQPGYMVGVSDFNGNWGGEAGLPDYFVIEADEYGINPPHDKTPKLTYLQPTHAICMNIDYDHPDVYDSLEQTKETFLKFFENILNKKSTGDLSGAQESSQNQNEVKKLLFCADDLNLMQTVQSLPKGSFATYGYSEEADFRIIELQSSETSSTFSLVHGENRYNFELSVFGEKNVSNAVAVIALLLQFGYEPSAIQLAIRNFTGAKRRFEQLTFKNNTYIFDDYAHHPHEIEATINAARLRFPTRKIHVLFQPHTFTRTESLKNEFVQALSKADNAYILPIFGSARETVAANSITSVYLETLAQSKKIENVCGFSSKEEALQKLQSNLQLGDVVFTMGAGDVYKLSEKIQEIIEKNK